MFAVIGQLLRCGLGILVKYAETASTSATSNSAGDEVLNCRAGKLDDGSDAACWLEKD